MKIISKFYIHPLYYIVAFISFFTGYFKAFSIYTLIILIHELGHITAGLILKWKISKIIIYPFGSMTIFDNKLNSSILEEFFVLIYGPLFQILFYFIYPTPYHYFILLFNLLPIYPLDGSKLFFLLLNKYISYYYSYIIIFIISYITIFLLLVYNINFISWLILFYLGYEVYRYIKKLNNIMLNFYYERYKNNYKYKKNQIIYGYKLRRLFKEKNNYFIFNRKCYSERDILTKMFDK